MNTPDTDMASPEASSGKKPVKHRRARTGCYTCRKRRVKCDETHPVCERCQKGPRTCLYPEWTTSTASEPTLPSPQSTRCSSEADDVEFLGASAARIGDFEEDSIFTLRDSSPDLPMASSPTELREEWPDLGEVNLLRLSKIAESERNASVTSPSNSLQGQPLVTIFQGQPWMDPLVAVEMFRSETTDWSHLPLDLQFLLHHHQRELTRAHYLFRHDSNEYLRTTLLDWALQYEPLLFAVAAFSGYSYTAVVEGKMDDFLEYYSRATTMLRQSLSYENTWSVPMMLTILEMATIEEHFGDYLVMQTHLKPAHAVFTRLFDPATVMCTYEGRFILGWYSRLDLLTAIVSGHEPALGREWYDSYHMYWVERASSTAVDDFAKIEELFAYQTLATFEMASLFAQQAQGLLSPDELVSRSIFLDNRVVSWATKMDPRLKGTRWLLMDRMSLDAGFEDGMLRWPNPATPPRLIHSGIWEVNLSYLDFLVIRLMQRRQLGAVLGLDERHELESLSRRVCHLFEAIGTRPENPRGIVPAISGCVAYAALFLPKRDKYTGWCRLRFADMERLGYILPTEFRKKMAMFWGIPEVADWWSNHVRFPRLVAEVRAFVEDRATPPRDAFSADLKDLNGIFCRYPRASELANTNIGAKEDTESTREHARKDANVKKTKGIRTRC